MAFFIRRSLSTGPIRFGVAVRRDEDSLGGSPFLLSTGPRGEFARRTEEGLYFDEHRDPALGDLDDASAAEKLNVWLLLRPEGASARSWIPLVLMVLGGLLIVFGAGVLVRKQDPIGWIEIVLGILLIIGPVIEAANRLRLMRQRVRKEREERARAEAERRRIVGIFAQRLEEFAGDPSPERLADVRRERKPGIPYDAVAPLGRAAVEQAGFRALGDLEKLGPAGVVGRIREAADAVGLNPDDVREVGGLIAQKVIWHLLADDRLTRERLNLVMDVGQGLGVSPEDLDREIRAADELREVCGITAKNLPVVNADGALRFGENCHHRTRGVMLKRGLRGGIREGKPFELFVTPKRVLLEGKPTESIAYPEIFGLEVDMELGILMITVRDRRSPLLLKLDDPIRTALMIDLSSTLPPKPKGLI